MYQLYNFSHKKSLEIHGSVFDICSNVRTMGSVMGKWRAVEIRWECQHFKLLPEEYGWWPSPVSPKTIFEWFFRKDYCFSRDLQSTIPRDYYFNGLWLPGQGFWPRWERCRFFLCVFFWGRISDRSRFLEMSHLKILIFDWVKHFNYSMFFFESLFFRDTFNKTTLFLQYVYNRFWVL